MYLTGIILATICVGLLSALVSEEHPIISLVLVIFAAIGIGLIKGGSYEKGIEEGAYNQLRGKYEITYVVNQDSIVTDTIINFK